MLPLNSPESLQDFSETGTKSRVYRKYFTSLEILPTPQLDMSKKLSSERFRYMFLDNSLKPNSLPSAIIFRSISFLYYKFVFWRIISFKPIAVTRVTESSTLHRALHLRKYMSVLLFACSPELVWIKYSKYSKSLGWMLRLTLFENLN